MKIFQIHVLGGCYDDYYDYIDSSYLDRTKAEMRVKELQDKLDKMCEQARKCEECCDSTEDYLCYVPKDTECGGICKNFVDYPQEYYDYERYTIEEVEVIE